MKKMILLLILAVLVFGCVSSSTLRGKMSFTKNGVSYPPRADDYQIDLYYSDRPTVPYDVIGEVNGYSTSEGDLGLLLMEKARRAGGDAVIDIKTSESTRTDMDIQRQDLTNSSGTIIGTTTVPQTYQQPIINVTAKVVRFR